jgi:hypothetical protein
VAPSLFGFVFENKVVPHYDQITVSFTVSHLVRHHAAKYIDIHKLLAFGVFSFKFDRIIKETKKVDRLYYSVESFLQHGFVPVHVAYINA